MPGWRAGGRTDGRAAVTRRRASSTDRRETRAAGPTPGRRPAGTTPEFVVRCFVISVVDHRRRVAVVYSSSPRAVAAESHRTMLSKLVQTDPTVDPMFVLQVIGR